MTAAELRRIFAFHNVVVIPRKAGAPKTYPIPFESEAIGTVFNINTGMTVFVESKYFESISSTITDAYPHVDTDIGPDQSPQFEASIDDVVTTINRGFRVQLQCDHVTHCNTFPSFTIPFIPLGERRVRNLFYEYVILLNVTSDGRSHGSYFQSSSE